LERNLCFPYGTNQIVAYPFKMKGSFDSIVQSGDG
jgi:hypothetical protein